MSLMLIYTADSGFRCGSDVIVWSAEAQFYRCFMPSANFRISLHLFRSVLNYQNLNVHTQHGVDNMASTLLKDTVWESQDSVNL